MKIKKILGLSMVALSAVGIAACDTKEDDNQGFTQEEVDQKVEEGVVTYAKTDAKNDLDAYKTNALTVSGVTDDANQSIQKAVDSGKTAIDAATTQSEVDTAYNNAVTAINNAIKTIQDENNQSAKEVLDLAKTNATEEIAAYSKAGMYLNTKDDGSVANIVKIGNSAIAKASTAEDVTEILTEAKEVLDSAFENLLEASYVEISSTEGIKGMVSGVNYKLTADVDFSAVNDTVGSNLTYSGIFNGNGYTIKNWNVNFAGGSGGNKRGILFRELSDGAVVQNLRMQNCSHISAGDGAEGLGLISSAATNATFRNIEIYGCTVDSGSKSYAGLLTSRNTKESVTVDQVTVKGNTTIISNTYTGGLLGDMRDMLGTAKLTNLDIDIVQPKSANASGILGCRAEKAAGTIIVENSRIKGTVSATSSQGKWSLLFGGDKVVTVNVKNTVFTAVTNESITADPIAGEGKNTLVTDNVYFNTEESSENASTSVAGVTAVTSSVLTKDWYYDTLGLDNKIWVEESNGGIKLIGASSNVVDDNAKLIDVEVLYSRAKTYYYFGEWFTSVNLVVMGTYENPDGVVLQAVMPQTVATNLGSYSVNPNAFDSSKEGTYTITVTATKTNPEGSSTTSTDDDVWTFEKTYKVTVNKLVSLAVYDNYAKKQFAVGDTFTTEGLIVKGVYSNDSTSTEDDVEETITDSSRYIVDSSAFNPNTPGTYTITIKDKTDQSITGSYEVYVAPKLEVAASARSIVLKVSPSYTNGTVEGTSIQFKTVSAALDYLTSLENANAFPENANFAKIIELAEGTYNEKITINLSNVVLKGAGSDKTTISYGAAAGHTQIDSTKGTYGTDNSATVIVKGKGFKAIGVCFENSFDYNGDKTAGSGTQALAIGVYADQAILKSCSFKGWQDTVQTKNGRQYFIDCYIEGCTDFIFGVESTTLFKNCEIKALNRNSPSNNGYVCAPKTTETYTYGYYFDGCNFTSEAGMTAGTVAVARPWGAEGTCVIINSTFDATYSTLGFTEGNTNKMNSRYEDMSGNSPINANFKEYGNTGAGAITEAVEGMTMMTAEEADKITLENLFCKDETVNYELWNAQSDLDYLTSL